MMCTFIGTLNVLVNTIYLVDSIKKPHQTASSFEYGCAFRLWSLTRTIAACLNWSDYTEQQQCD